MYIPEHFAEHDPDQLHRIIRDNPLGILVTTGETGMDADHIPFELEAGHGEFGLLTAHVARANPVWQRGIDGTPVMVIFRGADAYISPNWFESKHETHRWRHATIRRIKYVHR
jgi:transcriptional regulator